MGRWDYKLHIRDLVDEGSSAEAINAKKMVIAARLKTFVEDLPGYEDDMRDDFERMAQDFEDIPEEDNLNAFNWELGNLYDLCDAYRVWVKLRAGE